MRLGLIAGLLAAALAGGALAQENDAPADAPDAPLEDAPVEDAPGDAEDARRRDNSIRAFMPVEIPANAPQPKVEGVCVITFNVNDGGRVIGSTIVADCTSEELVGTAIDVAAGWRYEPRAQTGVVRELRFRRAG